MKAPRKKCFSKNRAAIAGLFNTHPTQFGNSSHRHPWSPTSGQFLQQHVPLWPPDGPDMTRGFGRAVKHLFLQPPQPVAQVQLQPPRKWLRPPLPGLQGPLRWRVSTPCPPRPCTWSLFLKAGALPHPYPNLLGLPGMGGEGLPKKADSWPWPWTWGSTCVSHKLKHLRGSFWVPPMVAANSLSWLAQP